MNSQSILVIGDVMLDIYYEGNVERISPEAPVPIFNKKNEHAVPGGAANVALNLISANQKVSILTVCGDDENFLKLNFLLEENSISTNYIYKDKSRKTTTKIRLMGNNYQQMIRIDMEDKKCISSNIEEKILTWANEIIADIDIIIVSDYDKGFLTKSLTKKIIEAANKNKKKVLVDVKDKDIDKYKNAFLLKPNLNELQLLTGKKINSNNSIENLSKELLLSCNCEYVLTTLGSQGMLLLAKNGTKEYVPCAAKEVYDVTGAGDTVISYLAVGLANGLQIMEAVNFANYAAGVKVSKRGTSAVSLQEVYDYQETQEARKNKVLTCESAKKLRRKFSGKIVFTNGCFDILHSGHVKYLNAAAKLGDLLIVGLNTDNSIKRIKGNSRPIISETDRLEVISALESVNYVVLFDEDTPYELIQIIQPDILVKGGDYEKDEIIGSDIVKARGGEVYSLPYYKGSSTTTIVERIKNNVEIDK